MQEQPPKKLRLPLNWHMIGLIFLCFVAGFLGAWAAIASDFINDDSDQAPSSSQVILQEEELVAEVAQAVAPSVVSIISSVEPRSLFDSGGEGAGTGIIISADGYIITNKHVVPEGAHNVRVSLWDGSTYDEVEIIGRDPLNDIAFLKINGAGDLTPAKIGDSSTVQIGQKVVAIGNALGQYQNTVTSGIISGLGRPVAAQSGQEIEQLSSLFQTDAAINPGNSGGPLVSLSGEVIGINTAIAESAEGIGFSIPINAAKGLIKGVLASGKVERSYLGVQFIEITAAVATDKGLPESVIGTALIDEQEGIVPDSPAQKAGLNAGDVIIRVNNTKVSSANSLSLLISEFQPGEKISLTILRDGKEQTVEVTLAAFES